MLIIVSVSSGRLGLDMSLYTIDGQPQEDKTARTVPSLPTVPWESGGAGLMVDRVPSIGVIVQTIVIGVVY